MSTEYRPGADPGGVLGVRTPPLLGEPPNFIKREKNGARVRSNGAHFST